MVFLSEILEKKKHKSCLLTGIDQIDGILGSVRDGGPGIPQSTVTELSGPPGSGRTALYLALALDALKQGHKVLYVSCNYLQFPWSRATKLEGWNDERYRDRVETRYVSEIEQLLAFNFDVSQYALVIIDRFEHLVSEYWDHSKQMSAFKAINASFKRMVNDKVVISVCGIRYVGRDMVPISTSDFDIARIQLYKQSADKYVLNNKCVFQITNKGITLLPPLETPVNQVILTPLSQQPFKRRASFCSPSRSHKRSRLLEIENSQLEASDYKL